MYCSLAFGLALGLEFGVVFGMVLGWTWFGLVVIVFSICVFMVFVLEVRVCFMSPTREA